MKKCQNQSQICSRYGKENTRMGIPNWDNTVPEFIGQTLMRDPPFLTLKQNKYIWKVLFVFTKIVAVNLLWMFYNNKGNINYGAYHPSNCFNY